VDYDESADAVRRWPCARSWLRSRFYILHEAGTFTLLKRRL
jgi:hypothetical protein